MEFDLKRSGTSEKEAEIIFLHGYDATPDSLRHCVSMLEEDGWQVHAPALRSFNSRQDEMLPSSDNWLQEACDACFAIMSGLPLRQFFFAGHSLGGAVCVHLLTGLLEPTLAARVIGCALLATPAGIDKEFLDFWNAVSNDKTGWSFAAGVQMLHFLRNTDPLFAKLAVPTLVLQGEDDQHIPSRCASALYARLTHTQSRLLLGKGADHFFVDNPEAASRCLQAAMLDFVREIASAGSRAGSYGIHDK